MNISKLRLELEGKPISPHLKVYVDDKKLSGIQNIKLTVDEDDIFVNIELTQVKTVEVDGKKEIMKEPIVLKWGK